MSDETKTVSRRVADRVLMRLRGGATAWLRSRHSDTTALSSARLLIARNVKPRASCRGTTFTVSTGALEEIVTRALRDVTGPPERPHYRARLLGLFLAHAFIRTQGLKGSAAIEQAGAILERAPELGSVGGVVVPMTVIELRGLKALLAGRRLQTKDEANRKARERRARGAKRRPRDVARGKARHTCDRCHRTFEAKDMFTGSGMCQSCYAKNWDEAFSSQAEYSDEMFSAGDDE